MSYIAHHIRHLIRLFFFASLSAVSRWRRVPVEYASTSEDEYGSNRHTSKQGQARPFSSPRVAQLSGSAPASPSPPGLAPVKQQSREHEEYMRDWTAHSEEIARFKSPRAAVVACLHPISTPTLTLCAHVC